MSRIKFFGDGENASCVLSEEVLPRLPPYGLAPATFADELPLPHPERFLSGKVLWWAHQDPLFHLATSEKRVLWVPEPLEEGGVRYHGPNGLLLTCSEEDIVPTELDSPAAHAERVSASFLRRLHRADLEILGCSSPRFAGGLTFIVFLSGGGNELSWGLLSEKDGSPPLFLGAGILLHYFQASPQEILVSSASLHESLQGKGVYLAVLKHLRQEMGINIFSDETLSLQALAFWKKHGAMSFSRVALGSRYLLRNPSPASSLRLIRTLLKDSIMTAAST